MNKRIEKIVALLKKNRVVITAVATLLLVAVATLALVKLFIPELWGLIALIFIAICMGVIQIQPKKAEPQEPQASYDVYYWIQERLMEALCPVLSAMGLKEDSALRENHIRQDCMTAKVNNRVVYKYLYILPFILSLSEIELQRALNQELYSQHELGSYIPIVLQVKIKGNRVFIVASVVCTDGEWYREYNRLQAAAIQPQVNNVKDSDF